MRLFKRFESEKLIIRLKIIAQSTAINKTAEGAVKQMNFINKIIQRARAN